MNNTWTAHSGPRWLTSPTRLEAVRPHRNPQTDLSAGQAQVRLSPESTVAMTMTKDPEFDDVIQHHERPRHSVDVVLGHYGQRQYRVNEIRRAVGEFGEGLPSGALKGAR